MPNTLGMLETARSGLTAAQLGLNVTSDNVANANTTGYSRKALDPVAKSADTGQYQIAPTTAAVGQGVSIKSVYQIRNSFLDVNYRAQNAQYNLYNGMASQLTSVEDYFTEISGSTATTNKLTGLSGQLDSLIGNITNYENSPTDASISQTVESGADLLTQSIRTESTELSNTLNSSIQDLNIIVSGGTGDTSNGANDGGINQIISNIQQLNTQISAYESGTGQEASDLRDSRNNLLDQLSGYVDISATEQSNGMVSVKLSGSGDYLVDSQNNANKFALYTDTTTGYTALEWKGVTTDVNGKDVTGTAGVTTPTGVAKVQGGLVKAYLNVIDGDGSGSDDVADGKSGSVGLVYMMQKLESFASGLYNTFNNAGGAAFDTSSMPTSGTLFLTYAGNTDTNGNITAVSPQGDSAGTMTAVTSGTTITGLMKVASSIRVSDGWSGAPSLFLSNYTGTSSSAYFQSYVNALQNKTGTVQTSTLTAVSVDSANAVSYTRSSATYAGSISSYADTFTTDLASAVSNASTKADWSQTNVENIENERESVSSVSTDDEAVNIIKYQQAYNANARVITTIDEMLDKLINGTGTVGLS